ncbi:MAG TPA: hypothetical protein VMB46_08815 [Methanomassiliicoccales archaeon]|nr:hypothetical protein [Methanomassiliicoccales archaeon]
MSEKKPDRTITPQLGAPIPQKQGPNKALVVGVVLIALVLVVALLAVIFYGLNTNGNGGGGGNGTHVAELNITVGSDMEWTMHNGSSVNGGVLAMYRWTVLAIHGTTITINETTTLAGVPASTTSKNVTKNDFLIGPTPIGTLYAFLPSQGTQNITTVFGPRLCDVYGGTNILGTGENVSAYVGQSNLVVYLFKASGNFIGIGGFGANAVTWVVSGGNIQGL